MRKKIIHKCGADIAKVHHASWSGSETNANRAIVVGHKGKLSLLI